MGVQVKSCVLGTYYLKVNFSWDEMAKYDLPASVNYALNILKKSGFTDTRVISPYRYTRPLIIGRKNTTLKQKISN